MSTPRIMEAYRKIGDPEDRFDIEYWQSQGPEAIFQAAYEMALDSIRVKDGHANQPRLQKSVESFQKL